MSNTRDFNQPTQFDRFGSAQIWLKKMIKHKKKDGSEYTEFLGSIVLDGGKKIYLSCFSNDTVENKDGDEFLVIKATKSKVIPQQKQKSTW